MMAMARLDIVGAMLFVAMGLTIWVLSDWVRRNTKPTPAVKIGVKSTYRRPQSSAESIGVHIVGFSALVAAIIMDANWRG